MPSVFVTLNHPLSLFFHESLTTLGMITPNNLSTFFVVDYRRTPAFGRSGARSATFRKTLPPIFLSQSTMPSVFVTPNNLSTFFFHESLTTLVITTPNNLSTFFVVDYRRTPASGRSGARSATFRKTDLENDNFK